MKATAYILQNRERGDDSRWKKKIEEILQVSLDGTPLPRTLWIQKVNKAHDTLDTTFAFKVWQKWGERLADFYTQK